MRKRIVCSLLVFLFVQMASLCSAEEIIYNSKTIVDSETSAATYPDFYRAGELSVVVPGLEGGYVPQGITYLAEEDAILFSGYSFRGEHSVLFEVNRETGDIIRQVMLINSDGTKYVGHSGGICATDENIYIADDMALYRISLETFFSLPEVSFCGFDEIIPVPVRANYCNYSEGILWVGEFEDIKDTDFSHGIMSQDGYQQAWACGYLISETQDFSAPDYILSTTDRIQGMTTVNGHIYLSRSYHRKNDSNLLKYNVDLAEEPDIMMEVNGKSVPLWILDRKRLEADLICPTMSEGMCTIDGEIYMVFESAGERFMDPTWYSRNPMDRVFKLTF